MKKQRKSGFDETNKQDSRLNYINADRVYKLFGVQSRVGGIGKHTSLKNWRDSRLLWVRDISTKIPHPAHFPIWKE